MIKCCGCGAEATNRDTHAAAKLWEIHGQILICACSLQASSQSSPRPKMCPARQLSSLWLPPWQQLSGSCEGIRLLHGCPRVGRCWLTGWRTSASPGQTNDNYCVQCVRQLWAFQHLWSVAKESEGGTMNRFSGTMHCCGTLAALLRAPRRRPLTVTRGFVTQPPEAARPQPRANCAKCAAAPPHPAHHRHRRSRTSPRSRRSVLLSDLSSSSTRSPPKPKFVWA